ncbi:DUF4261 domain-containing protein [Methylocystis suflitae]|uniref:DUF4261 domain-containing protein n=1 Tax=Methylocystis suflitae TaxID=2951405 RepID=UPI00210B859D|nr:DUF4261 domain-containing protein [Methylocystis suflitae]MCQ4191518.1 DUF4261 domain-containing protein [Methylocystis suflitae]
MPSSTSESTLAIVMTAGEEFPSNAFLAQAIKARIPAIVIPPEILADPNGTLVFLHEDDMFAVGKVDAPCPISKDDPCVQFTWYWPDAWEAVSTHKAHLLPSVSGGADAKRRAALHGQLVAAVVDAARDAVAVHWASSDSLWPAPLVAQTIAPGDQKPPVPFCVAIKLSRDADGGVSGATRGLAAFGLMEIEAEGFKGDPRQLNGLMLDLAGYLIEAGPVIKDGDTIGPDAGTKIVVRHETSGFVPGQPVYRLYESENSRSCCDTLEGA